MVKRYVVQLATTVLYNLNFIGFFQSDIYKGSLKAICVPGLNCYSCPGALFSCPIGSLQAVIANGVYKIPFYVVGLLTLFGVMLGRFICGFLCPFGFFQELLYKIPIKKINMPKLEKMLTPLKYIILAIFVVLMPLFLTNKYGISEPYFCKWICPAGTLEGGIPLVVFGEDFKSIIGALFYFKISILVILILLSVVIYRPFCKFLCPLGAIYSFFNRVSFLQLNINEKKCISCNKCVKVCKMNVDVMKNPNSPECIRCMECADVCPESAITMGFQKIKDNDASHTKNNI